jgi:putative transposase
MRGGTLRVGIDTGGKLLVLLLTILHTYIITFGRHLLSKLRSLIKPMNHSLPGGVLTDLTRNRQDLMVENTLLRQQVLILQRQIKRPRLTWYNRIFLVVLCSRLKGWQQAVLLVKPETVLK